MKWDPFSHRCWALAAGMARVSWFGAARNDMPGEYNVLLDGHAASFAFAESEDPSLAFGDDTNSWSWSSNLRRALILNPKTGDLVLRTWDQGRDRKRLKLPRSAAEAEALVNEISKTPRPRTVDVITQMLAAFKLLRGALSSYNAPNAEIVRVFNALMEASEVNEARGELAKCSSVADVTSIVGGHDLVAYHSARIEDTIDLILHPASPSVPVLDARLLIRHASGQFYQEAHFELERQSAIQMSLFGGRASNTTGRGKQQRDARYTPTELARSLAEQSLLHLSERKSITILDPACGSGVFLQEALRDLEASAYRGQVRLLGFDSSPVSKECAEFCLRRAKSDAIASGMKVECEIRQCDALVEEWGSPDVILMNPPFTTYNDMTDAEREQVREVLGEAGFGNLDKSQAFISKAARSIAEGGVFATVLPSTLFDTTSGEKWRHSITGNAAILLLGRFRGYNYFPGALVEPGFVIATRNSSSVTKLPMKVLMAEEGAEGIALRALRRGRSQSGIDNEYYISLDHGGGVAQSSGWMPRSFEYDLLLAALEATGTAGKLFDVRQGSHTGANEIFILSQSEFDKLPVTEHRFFRPAAGTKTIRDGQLLQKEYVFYPYGENGLLINTEDELCDQVPQYFETHLRDHKDRLLTRPKLVRAGETKWWALNWDRPWQHTAEPKIVSAYFGGVGSFAYDHTGEYVCLHGYAWMPMASSFHLSMPTGEDDDVVSVSFFDTNLPWAYIGILNSYPFRILLSCFCSRVQGGQYNLSKRFVENVPLPNLAEGIVPGDLIEELAGVGRGFAESGCVNHDLLTSLVSRAYGISQSEWRLDEAGK